LFELRASCLLGRPSTTSHCASLKVFNVLKKLIVEQIKTLKLFWQKLYHYHVVNVKNRLFNVINFISKKIAVICKRQICRKHATRYKISFKVLKATRTMKREREGAGEGERNDPNNVCTCE
jgi:hypothetical protein